MRNVAGAETSAGADVGQAAPIQPHHLCRRGRTWQASRMSLSSLLRPQASFWMAESVRLTKTSNARSGPASAAICACGAAPAPPLPPRGLAQRRCLP
jgi:hypothetical protein